MQNWDVNIIFYLYQKFQFKIRRNWDNRFRHSGIPLNYVFHICWSLAEAAAQQHSSKRSTDDNKCLQFNFNLRLQQQASNYCCVSPITPHFQPKRCQQNSIFGFSNSILRLWDTLPIWISRDTYLDTRKYDGQSTLSFAWAHVASRTISTWFKSWFSRIQFGYYLCGDKYMGQWKGK